MDAEGKEEVADEKSNPFDTFIEAVKEAIYSSSTHTGIIQQHIQYDPESPLATITGVTQDENGITVTGEVEEAIYNLPWWNSLPGVVTNNLDVNDLPRDGFWLVYGYDVGSYPICSYESELEALRFCVERHCNDYVVFWPFGTTWDELMASLRNKHSG
jgi:hypothetical protein